MSEREQIIEAVTKKLVADGKLIEAGWVGLRLLTVPIDAPQIQIDEMRNAFFAGAQHLFASIMTILDPGSEPTDADLERMELIDRELAEFGKQLESRITKPEGSS